MVAISQAGGSPDSAMTRAAQTTQPAASADTSEAARLARECLAVTQAVTLARWIGEKPRPVTPGEVLRKADVAAAGSALGITVPAKLRTAADLPDLHLPWLTAVATGLIQISDNEASTASVLADWAPDDTGLLTGWLAGLRAVCAAGTDRRHRDSHGLLPLAMLIVLARGNAPTGKKMWPVVNAALHETYGFSSELYQEAWHAAFGYSSGDRLDPVPRLCALLTTFGAATTIAGRPQITALGRWALGQLQASLPIPVNPDLPAGDLLARLTVFGRDGERRSVARDWLKARTTATAAREILAAADQASASVRLVAIDMVRALGEDALPVFREMARAPSVGPYARAFVAAYSERGRMTERDRRWLAVDRAVAALTETGPDEALTQVCETFAGTDLDGRLDGVRATGHPEAEVLAGSLAEFAASGAPRSVDAVLQIKVTLARWRPAIWRRVLVPAATTLGDLHLVIQVLYGWEGDHLHGFAVGKEQYGDPFYSPEDMDEAELRLAAAFGPDVRKILYTYDYGAGWEHEITLEKKMPRKPGQAYPVCVAFSGDSPVEYEDDEEYEDEDESTEPKPFSLTQVNHRLQANEHILAR